MDGKYSVPSRDAEPLRRPWLSATTLRRNHVGLWAWLLQRVSAIALVITILLHLEDPFVRSIQALLLALVLLHGLLGLRALILDVGVSQRLHVWLFSGALTLGGLLFVAFWALRWY